MSTLDGWIRDVIGSQSNPLNEVNSGERDGNAEDLLLRFEQSANALSVSGGTTFTDISPINAIGDLQNGKLSWRAIVWLVILAAMGYYLLKKA